MKVRALYDFSGEPSTAELSIVTGEVLTVTRQDVGEGWWEGTNEKGQTGLFPAAYVEEEKSSNPPSMPPPPLPESFANDWDNQQSTDNQTPNYEAVDYWDDEWDDDSESGAPPPPPDKDRPPSLPPKTYAAADDVSVATYGSNRSTMQKKNANRFTMFTKSGGENYIMGTLKLTIPEADKIYIVEEQGECRWRPVQEHYTVMVASPKKDTKFKGLKSFIAYQLTPTFNNIQVSRRYKHFDWLHERLEEKFSLIPIPPLPDKQISGRYEGQFIERRKNQLQAFVDCVCRHPVLSRCAVWEHFVTCTDEKRWKPGKRRAEKDELTGANYFLAVQAPERPLQVFVVEQDTEKCSRFVHSMDGAVKNLMACSVDQTKKHQGHYKREYQKIGQSFCDLSHAFSLGEIAASPPGLTEAIHHAGDTYNDIATLFEEQPKHDWEPLGDLLHIYKGILAAFPDILNVHKDAMQKRKECERLETEHKMDAAQVAEVQRRTDIISFALLAEIAHFHEERATQVRSAMRSFLAEQVTFYQKVAAKLQDAYSLFEE